MPFLDIGSMELLIVAVLALIVVGPRELPRMMRMVLGAVRTVQGVMTQVRQGVDDLAREVEAEVDPFQDLRKAEGLKPSMTPEEITEKIMGNRGKGLDPSTAEPEADSTAPAADPVPEPEIGPEVGPEIAPETGPLAPTEPTSPIDKKELNDGQDSDR